jgi:hypothetical protein
MSAMRERLIELAERRARLQAQARVEREDLGAFVGRVDQALALLDPLRRVIAELRRQPWIVAGGVALLFALRPKRTLGWLMKGWTAWRLYRSAQRWWRHYIGRAPDAA